MKFRKKPVVIDAWQWKGHTHVLDPELRYHRQFDAETGHDFAAINTLEGRMTVAPGDWIIRGVQGEIYPCKPDIFEMTYEPAEDR